MRKRLRTEREINEAIRPIIEAAIYFKENNKDAVKNAKEAIDFAKKNGNDVIIIDTAGRLQIDEEMMAELVKIKKVTDPVQVLLVADSMTGQNAVAIPIMLQNGISNFVSLLDNIMVGRLGTEQMSGVSIVNQLVFIFFLCIFGAIGGWYI